MSLIISSVVSSLSSRLIESKDKDDDIVAIAFSPFSLPVFVVRKGNAHIKREMTQKIRDIHIIGFRGNFSKKWIKYTKF